MKKSTFLNDITSSTLLLDGAIGTMIQNLNLQAEDYGGEKFQMLSDLLTLSHPDKIERIHLDYFESGANAVETNTFGASKLRFDEFDFTQIDTSHFPQDIQEQNLQEMPPEELVTLLNTKAVQVAKRALEKYKMSPQYDGRNLYVVGSLGPSNYILSSTQADLKKGTFEQIRQNFFDQTLALAQTGADIILLETQQDILELKAAIFGVQDALQACQLDLPIIAQVTVTEFGKMQIFNTDLLAAITTVANLKIDMFGVNCSIGPKQMEPIVAMLAKYCPLPFSVVPNAGMPRAEEGKTIFDVSTDEFSDILVTFVTKYGASLVGGCCGTTPEYIQVLQSKLQGKKKAQRTIDNTVYISGPQQAVSLEKTSKLLLIGERLNIRGSKKVRLATENDAQINHTALEEVVQEQVRDLGIQIIDICMDSNQIDTTKTLCDVIEKQTYDFTGTMCIDSFDVEALTQAILHYPGRPIINSISLEEASKGVSKIDAVLSTTARHQPIYIALTTDGQGPATTAKQKIELAKQIIEKIKPYHIKPNQILIDINAFPIGSETEETMNFSLESLEAIAPIKALQPGLKTSIGVGNLTNGLAKKPYMRKVLTSVFLYEAEKRGLNAAIINPNHYVPITSLDKNDVTLANRIIFEKDMDAFAQLEDIALAKTGKTVAKKSTYEDLSIEDSICQKIKDGYKNQQQGSVEYQGKKYDYTDTIILSIVELLKKDLEPLTIINDYLMKAMEELGDGFSSGDISLPHLLKSADVMKQVMSFLELIMQEENNGETTKKAKIVLGTVYQDVHSIGKDLVKTLLQNYGYEVIDLGVQVEPEKFVQTAINESADAIGMSALLVQTSNHMATVAKLCRENNIAHLPILIGGAPVNHKHAAFVSQNLSETNQIVPHVFYCASAMDSVTTVNRLFSKQHKQQLLEQNQKKLENAYTRTEKQTETTNTLLTSLPKRKIELSSTPDLPVNTPWQKTYNFDPIEVLPFINYKNLFSLNWRYGSKQSREKKQINDVDLEKKLISLLEQATQKNYFSIKGACGIYPCHKRNDTITIENPTTGDKTILTCARIIGGEKKDIFSFADYFQETDYIGLQLATAGELEEKLSALKIDLETSWLLNGLANRIAEDIANFLTDQLAKLFTKINISPKRYSPGYPTLPDLQNNETLVSFFGKQTGVIVTPSYGFKPTCSTGAFVTFHPKASYR